MKWTTTSTRSCRSILGEEIGGDSMYLSELKLWNFRKFGSSDIITDKNEIRKPDLEVQFQNGLNVLIGENDSGKTTIIDAIKLVLKTHSTEWIRVNFEDFYEANNRFRVECIFRGFEGKDEEAMHFTEWLGMEGEGESAVPYLRLIVDIQHNGDRVLPFDIRAGVDDIGSPLSADARDYLKTTYLKPLRDAQQELIPRRNSRLSQILEGHEVFKVKTDEHELKIISRCFDCLIQKYFDREYVDKDCTESDCPIKDRFLPVAGSEKKIREDLNMYIQKFLGEIESKAKFGVVSPKLKNILEGLKLSFDQEFDPGLGTQNLLFIAAELLNLDRSDWSGLRLGLIEELEAHLHPQAQLRVIEYLQNFIRERKKDIQFVLTTHSPNLGSKIDLKSLIICFEKEVFHMGDEYTELGSGDYGFLQRFLDVTKANLFFAKGVILVEGWSEELLVPTLARKIGIDLTQKGVSIVNVGGTSFLRYGKIFQRKDGKSMNIPVAIITDLDVKPDEELIQENSKTKKDIAKENKENKFNGQTVMTFVSKHWTLEYC
jgi:putative ATP-dependent endonuclease of OLD family